MNSIQSQTQKIQKISRRDSSGARNYICGACQKAYKFYPSLYLHIRRSHDGIRPPGTTVARPIRMSLDLINQTGRPKKSDKDIDIVSETKAFLEVAQNDLMRLLGEKLLVTKNMSPKPTFEFVVQRIAVTWISEPSISKWLKEVQEGSKDFLLEYKDRDSRMINPDFEEDFMNLDPSHGLKVIVWFLIWLAKVYVKAEFIPDLCLILAMVWKVMAETHLGAQDLDNKLVWKKVMKECEGLLKSLCMFKNNLTLLNEFIKIVCQIIGKAFDDGLE